MNRQNNKLITIEITEIYKGSLLSVSHNIIIQFQIRQT